MKETDIETYYPTSRADWRRWLQKHHLTRQSVWLIQYKQSTGTPSLSWSDAVDEALCHGWIDSVRKTLDDERFIQFFSRRKPRSVWSQVNKAKIERLIAEGLMTPAGLVCVDVAKQNGSWTILDTVEEIPKDLEKAFKSHKGSKAFFLSLSRSMRKAILQWLILAKRPETREKRITEIASLAGQGMKPKQFS